LKKSISLPLALLMSAGSVYAQSPAAPAGAPVEGTPHARVVVSSTPLGGDPFDQTQPITILTGDELKLRLETTLGDTLSREAGVSSTSFGPGAGRPIIRGLGEDRIRVLQNGVSTIDASSISPDHAVTVEPLTIRTIDVVRGPATLLYGPNTVGGVVNVLDNRIPTERLARPIEGRVEGRYGTVDDLRSGAGIVEFGLGNVVVHLDGFIRETDDVRIPGFARSRRLRELDPHDHDEDEPRGILPNSFTESWGGAAGASYIWDGGYVGFSYSGLESRYGVIVEEDVTIDLRQHRWDLRGAFLEPFSPIKAINYKFSYSDYTHTEFEGDEVGTVFDVTGYEGRVEIVHQPLGLFEGVLGYQGQYTDFSAAGEEAFVPPTETVQHGVFLFEELALNPVRLQFGLRYDHLRHDAMRRDDHDHDHDHDDHHHDGALSRSFNALSASGGIVYTPVEPWVIAFSVAYTQRPPTSVELFSDGPHIATGAFEVGNPNFGKEESLAFDLSFRRKVGRVTGSVNFFLNRFNGFITAFPTGEFSDDDDHDQDHEHDDDNGHHHDPLPIFAYRSVDANFYGGELSLTLHILEPRTAEASAPAEGKGFKGDTFGHAGNPHDLHLDLKADYVRAHTRDGGGSLPRITPFRTSAALVYGWNDRFTARVEGQYVHRQNRTADFELPTDSYFLLNASASYRIGTGPVNWDLFVRGTNLTNAEARMHTSFLKDIAPLAGRGAQIGLRATF
jgi:iron complex outermembrane receptor protein